MKLAETVTFGGSGLDRAAHLRSEPSAMQALKRLDDAEAIVFWRGKPMIRRGERDALARFPVRHPALQEVMENAIFLGLEGNSGRFAVDLSRWQPDDIDPSIMGGFLDPTEQRHPHFEENEVFAELRANMTRLTPRDAELAASALALYNWHRSHRFCAKCGGPSEITMSGWQRNCTACGASHFPRTDPVVIMLITHGNSVLLGRSPGWPEGMYSLLAGFVEPGETLEAAVRREVYEEAGVEVGSVEYLSSQPWPFPNSLMFGCRGEALSSEIEIDPHEIEDAIWVSKEELMQAFAGEHPKILPARKGAIAHFLLDHWLKDRLD